MRCGELDSHLPSARASDSHRAIASCVSSLAGCRIASPHAAASASHRGLSSCPLISLRPSWTSSPAGCCIAYPHVAAFLPLAPLPLVAPSPLITPLSGILSGWLSHHLSSGSRLPSASACASCHAITSCASRAFGMDDFYVAHLHTTTSHLLAPPPFITSQASRPAGCQVASSHAAASHCVITSRHPPLGSSCHHLTLHPSWESCPAGYRFYSLLMPSPPICRHLFPHCAVASCHAPLGPLVSLVVALPLFMLLPPICQCLHLSLHHCLLGTHQPCPVPYYQSDACSHAIYTRMKGGIGGPVRQSGKADVVVN